MKRREFITLLGGAAATWPLAARAQQPTPVVGYLSTGTRESDEVPYLAPFRQGLKEMGYVEGQNVEIEYRWAEFQNDRLAQLAADLVRRQINVIATIGGSPPVFAARALTTKVPIVFYSGVDPVKSGLVKSLNRPGGNLTGIAALQAQLIAKRIELLNETVRNIQVVTLLINPTNPYSETETEILYGGARMLKLELHVVRASKVADFEAAFKELKELRTQALLISADLFLHGQREKLVALAARYAMPTIYPWREYVAVGGLMSYGPSLREASRLIGVYSGKILRGADPAELPVEQQTKVDFAINLKTAKTLGLTFSLPLSGRADEVIE
ncbi:MAG TPA: ABC transporter substrate-binding protein [Pseudolabrys sp.]|jgi:putative ABC transport system substrate-binding protein